MAKEAGNKDITLDDLLKIVESAARTIERLQAANASLILQIRDVELAAELAAADAQTKSQQIEELEKSEAALREDAQWCRWFKDKYGSSTFFSHIERVYQQTHHTENPTGFTDQSGVAPDAS